MLPRLPASHRLHTAGLYVLRKLVRPTHSKAERIGDLISYRNDGKGSTAIVGKVESA